MCIPVYSYHCGCVKQLNPLCGCSVMKVGQKQMSTPAVVFFSSCSACGGYFSVLFVVFNRASEPIIHMKGSIRVVAPLYSCASTGIIVASLVKYNQQQVLEWDAYYSKHAVML